MVENTKWLVELGQSADNSAFVHYPLDRQKHWGSCFAGFAALCCSLESVVGTPACLAGLGKSNSRFGFQWEVTNFADQTSPQGDFAFAVVETKEAGIPEGSLLHAENSKAYSLGGFQLRIDFLVTSMHEDWHDCS